MDRRSFVQLLGASGVLTATGCIGDLAPTKSSSTQSDDPPSSSGSASSTDSAQDREQWWQANYDTQATSHNPTTTPVKPDMTEWSVTLPKMHSPTQSVMGEDRVYTGIEDYESTPAESKLVARSISDGTVDWRIDLPYSGVAPPALGRGPEDAVTLFVATSEDHSNTGPGNGTVRALDPRTGDQHWEWPVESELGGLVVTDGSVLVTTVSLGKVAVHCLDATEGTEQWSNSAKGWLHHVPTIHNGVGYYSSSRTELTAVALETNETVWSTPTRADDTRPVVDPYRELVYMGHPRGLEAFHLADGSRAWEFITTPTNAKEENYLGVIDEPVVMDDQLVLRTNDTSGFALGDVGYCYGVNPETGKQTWKLSERRPASSIIGSGDRMLLRLADSASAVPTLGRRQVADASEVSLAALDSEGSIVWEKSTLWVPMAVGSESLLCYKGSINTDAETVDIGLLPTK